MKANGFVRKKVHYSHIAFIPNTSMLIAPSTYLCFVSYEMRSLVLRQASKKSEIDESVRVFTVVSVVQNASNLTVTALLIY